MGGSHKKPGKFPRCQATGKAVSGNSKQLQFSSWKSPKIFHNKHLRSNRDILSCSGACILQTSFMYISCFVASMEFTSLLNIRNFLILLFQLTKSYCRSYPGLYMPASSPFLSLTASTNPSCHSSLLDARAEESFITLGLWAYLIQSKLKLCV